MNVAETIANPSLCSSNLQMTSPDTETKLQKSAWDLNLTIMQDTEGLKLIVPMEMMQEFLDYKIAQWYILFVTDCS